MRLFLIKTEGGDLIPDSNADAAYISKLKPGEALECDTRKVRNPGHHRLFFALFNTAFESQDRYKNKRDMMTDLKIRAGWYDEHVTTGGEVVYVPKSLSWARMGQDEFEAYFDQAVIALAEMCSSEEITLEADRIIAKGVRDAVA